MLSSKIIKLHMKSYAIIQDHVIFISYHILNLSESTVNDKKATTTKISIFYFFLYVFII